MSGQGEHLGPYELRGELGRGAMARVWRGYDPNLDREVAIKEPLFDSGMSEQVLEEMGRRFVREGKVAARLNHPGIVSIYAADVYDGRPAIVMELVDGLTLADLLESGPLSPDAALDALDQLLDAVGYAHEQGIVHRDIKPENIFVDAQGRLKLSDFGIAHIDDPTATRATVVGTVLGTPGYMSPEQVTGGQIDYRSDLFSVGVVAYEMLAGRNPFGADGSANPTTILYRIVHEPVAELPASAAGLASDLRPAVMAALSKNPDERPQSAIEFKAMLHGAGTGVGVGAGVAPMEQPAHPTTGGAASWRRFVPLVVGVAACVVALALVIPALSGQNGAVQSGQNEMASSAATAAPEVEKAWFGSTIKNNGSVRLNDLKGIEGEYFDNREGPNTSHGYYAQVYISDAKVSEDGLSGTCVLNLKWLSVTNHPIENGVAQYKENLQLSFDPEDPSLLTFTCNKKGDDFWCYGEFTKKGFRFLNGEMNPHRIEDPDHRTELTRYFPREKK